MSAPAPRSVALRGTVVHCRRDPGPEGDPAAVEVVEDGVLLIREGRVAGLAPAREMLAALEPGLAVEDHRGRLIVPGFVDVHVHYPQTDIIASHGERLLEWLERYAFPAERRFADPGHAREVARFFTGELLRHGTTTALVFATVHPGSADAIFEAALARGMRLAAGKVLMDRNCPRDLRDTAAAGYRDSRTLIEGWHGRGRLLYAVTPRFAPTSSEAQLEAAGALAREHPGVLVHTHVAENPAEVEWVARLFPWSRSYLDVYDRFGLLGPGTVLAHCIHLDGEDRARLAEAGASIAFCPTSNLFLGSGLFDLEGARGIRVGLGTDVGGGTSFSVPRTAAAGYEVAHLRGRAIAPWRAFYLATLGGATALRLEDRIGSFEPGMEADAVVLDPAATPLLARRSAAAGSLEEVVFALLMLGDDRTVEAVYLEGRLAHARADGGV